MLKIPFATQLGQLMRERGDYPEGYLAGPRGCVVHFTAGRFEKGVQSAKDSIHDGIENDYTYLCISHDAILVQAHDILKWGYHAGESAWHIIAKKLKIYGSVSDDLIGIEMNNAGKLEYVPGFGFKSWFGTWIPKGDVREIKKGDVYKANGKTYEWACPVGPYHKYTPEQEDMLIKTIMWLYVNCPSFKLEYVLGHHEVAGVLGIGYWRKNDPGGSLSMPMEAFRAYLITNKDALVAKYGIKKVS